MKYEVLKEVYTAQGRDAQGNTQYAISWKKIGVANNYEDAKNRYGGFPVIAEAK